MQGDGLRAEADVRNQKIREQTLQRVPFLLVAGGNEREADTIAIRSRDSEDLGVLPLAQAMTYLHVAAQALDLTARIEAHKRMCARLGTDTDGMARAFA